MIGHQNEGLGVERIPPGIIRKYNNRVLYLAFSL
jgi:hypothetical protein